MYVNNATISSVYFNVPIKPLKPYYQIDNQKTCPRLGQRQMQIHIIYLLINELQLTFKVQPVHTGQFIHTKNFFSNNFKLASADKLRNHFATENCTHHHGIYPPKLSEFSIAPPSPNLLEIS